jgi:centromere/kinetochore protein ZW10
MLMTSAPGLGTPQSAKHYERQMVGKDEGKQIASSGNMANQDWDAAWNSEEEEPLPQEINRASLEEERRASEISPGIPAAPQDDDDDAAEAWGWDDEDAVDEPSSASAVEPPSPGNPAPVRIGPETREITLSETYYTSSIPRPLFNTVAGIFNDCARLTSPECVSHCTIAPLRLTI